MCQNEREPCCSYACMTSWHEMALVVSDVGVGSLGGAQGEGRRGGAVAVRGRRSQGSAAQYHSGDFTTHPITLFG